MDIGLIRGATRILGNSQGYLGLPVRDEVINCAVNGEETSAMVTEWRPSMEELQALACGGCIQVRILGVTHPPIMVGVVELEDTGEAFGETESAQA